MDREKRSDSSVFSVSRSVRSGSWKDWDIAIEASSGYEEWLLSEWEPAIQSLKSMCDRVAAKLQQFPWKQVPNAAVRVKYGMS